jgi:hypothetical protein
MPLDAARWQIDILAADKTAAAFSSVEKRMKALEVSQAQIGGVAARGFGAAVAALRPYIAGLTLAAAAYKVWEAGMKAGDLGEQAEQLNVTADQLQAYRLAAAQAGLGAEQLDTALMKLTKSMGAANDGDDELIKKFDKLGVKLLSSAGELRKPADVLPELSRGLLALGSETERNALLMEFFGRSGGRTATMLQEWARGSDDLVAAAKRQNAVVGGETIKAWDDLSDQLKVSEQRLDTLLATAARPVATVGLNAINFQVSQMVYWTGLAKRGWDALAGGFNRNADSSEVLIKRQEVLKATVDNLANSTDALDVAKVAGMRKELQEISDVLASRAKVFTMPPVVVAGAAQPTGKKAAAAGEKLDVRLKELVDERQALERALAAFDVKGTQTVDEVDRKLNAQVTLDKKIFDVLKDVPPNSALAGQLKGEATAISELNQKLDERKRLLSEGETTTAQYGDGVAVAARETAHLNAMLAAGAIDAGTYARALKEVNEKAGDQERLARGAAGGWQGYFAGLEQGMADMRRANTEFEIGRRAIQSLDEVIDVLAGTSNKTFGQIAADFALMIAKMEMQAALSSVWKGIGGTAGVASFFGSLFSSNANSGGFADLGSGAGSTGGVPNFSGMAAGGDIDAGDTHLVGEEGPELFTPRRSGRIVPNDQLGGGDTYIVTNHFSFGSDVNRGTLATWAEQVVDRSVAAMIDKRGRGGRVKKVFA